MTITSPVTLKTFSEVLHHLSDWRKSSKKPLLVGIGGPGGSGKSTLTHWLHGEIRESQILTLDDFRLPRAERKQTGHYGSHPAGNDLFKLQQTLLSAKKGEPIRQPVFDREKGCVLNERELPEHSVLLVDGELTTHQPIRSHLDRLIVVNTSLSRQLSTRMNRDRRDRGVTLQKALHLFWQSNLQDYPRYGAAGEQFADLYLTRGHRHVFHLRKPV